MLEQKKRLLLYRLRKEMNGAALDTMCYFGTDYARNYGVQIYAIRNLAREIGIDHELAKAFYAENIREVRLVALWIADAESISVADFDFWGEGIINSEVAEQASHALFSRIAEIATGARRIMLCLPIAHCSLQHAMVGWRLRWLSNRYSRL